MFGISELYLSEDIGCRPQREHCAQTCDSPSFPPYYSLILLFYRFFSAIIGKFRGPIGKCGGTLPQRKKQRAQLSGSSGPRVVVHSLDAWGDGEDIYNIFSSRSVLYE